MQLLSTSTYIRRKGSLLRDIYEIIHDFDQRKWSELWMVRMLPIYNIKRSHFKACEYMKEGQISYLYLFVCDQSNHYYDCCDGFSIELGTNQLNPFCRIIIELKEKSFDLKNDHFRIGIVLLSYIFLPGKWDEMVCLELYQIGVRAYAFFCLLSQGQERQKGEVNCTIVFTISWFLRLQLH